MKQEIIKDKIASEIPETVTDAKIYQEGINLLYSAQQHGLAKFIAECAAIYNLRVSGAYADEGKNSEKFLSTVGMKIRSAQMRLRIARLMEKSVRLQIGRGEGTFHFTERSISQTFAPFFEKHRNISITELYKASCDYQTFQNFLEGNTDIRESEITKLLTTGTKDEPAAPAQSDLFTMHDAIKRAGYKLRDDGTWLDPRTGEPMTREQLAEFVDEETGFYLFSSAKKMLVEMSEKLAGQQKYSEYVHAYMLKHPSPETEKIVQEQQKELADLAGDILYIATTILSEEEN